MEILCCKFLYFAFYRHDRARKSRQVSYGGCTNVSAVSFGSTVRWNCIPTLHKNREARSCLFTRLPKDVEARTCPIHTAAIYDLFISSVALGSQPRFHERRFSCARASECVLLAGEFIHWRQSARVKLLRTFCRKILFSLE